MMNMPVYRVVTCLFRLKQILPLVMFFFFFSQTDVMHQSVYELVHTEDQQELRRNLHWALNPPPAAASAVAQDSPQGDHSLLLHESVVKTTAKRRDPGGTDGVFTETLV